MSKKLIVLALALSFVAVAFATVYAPFTDSLPPSTVSYGIAYKTLLNVADSAASTGTFYRFPRGTIGAYLYHSDTGDSIQFELPSLYKEDTVKSVVTDEWVPKLLPLLDSVGDTLALFDVGLSGVPLKIGYMPYGDTLDTLWMVLFIKDEVGTKQQHENLQ